MLMTLLPFWDASDGQNENDLTLGVARAFFQVGLAGGLQLSDDDPAPVAITAIPGDAVTAMPGHGHKRVHY